MEGVGVYCFPWDPRETAGQAGQGGFPGRKLSAKQDQVALILRDVQRRNELKINKNSGRGFDSVFQSKAAQTKTEEKVSVSSLSWKYTEDLCTSSGETDFPTISCSNWLLSSGLGRTSSQEVEATTVPTAGCRFFPGRCFKLPFTSSFAKQGR